MSQSSPITIPVIRTAVPAPRIRSSHQNQAPVATVIADRPGRPTIGAQPASGVPSCE